jgi:hypothetical protein
MGARTSAPRFFERREAGGVIRGGEIVQKGLDFAWERSVSGSAPWSTKGSLRILLSKRLRACGLLSLTRGRCLIHRRIECVRKQLEFFARSLQANSMRANRFSTASIKFSVSVRFVGRRSNSARSRSKSMAEISNCFLGQGKS